MAASAAPAFSVGSGGRRDGRFPVSRSFSQELQGRKAFGGHSFAILCVTQISKN